jgi:signal transduction histidine kinase
MDKIIKVLLIEDNPGDAQLIQELLSDVNRASFQIEVAGRLSDGLETLSKRTFDVVLLDLSLPDCSGLETLAKAHSENNEVAIIVLTGLSDEEIAVKALRKGAQDYMVKGQVDENLLYRSIRYAIERKQVENEKKVLEAELLQLRKMEAIGTLAGGMAHNFNNLLMGIQGNAYLMLLDIDPNHPHHGNLKAIEEHIQSGSQLTRQLLGYARGGKYEMRPISLNQLVKETSDIFGMTKKEIRIHHELAENLFGIIADQVQIEQVLLNLYINAADAMDGGGDIFLKTINATHKEMTAKPYKPKPGNYVMLTVRDTGIGMDKETKERIFDPFFSTKEMGRGTGLGLASVYGIIKAHGGFIDVDSEKGQGTIFSIYLPATGKKVETIKKEKKVPGEILRGTETILLVDDEAQVLDVGIQIFKSMGYTVLGATSGKEAIEIFEKNRDKIAIVILDMIMPDMGGGETYDKLKEINPKIKVLLSSGYSIDGQATEIMQRGCNGFIQKPFKIKGLSLKLREILDTK